jgi:butyrate kinase
MSDTAILVINLGSTSTKIAYYVNNECIVADSLTHNVEQIRKCKDVTDQYQLRRDAILEFMSRNGIILDELDSVTTRGGQTEPIVGGTYRINEAMVEQVRSGEYGHHVCGVGVLIAYDLCCESDHAVALTTDTPTTDEMDPIARYSGLKEIDRVSCVQALNIKAMSRYYASTHDIPFEDARLITVMLGGGIGVCAIRDGRMVDATDSLEGEGPFSNNRCGTVPLGRVIKMCYSGKYNLEGMIRHINGEAGLMAYLGTTDLRKIMKNIDDGDEHSREVIQAMCYQTSKEIGAMATVLEGNVDAIILTGGMANIGFIVDEIKRRVGFIAHVEVMPGEREMIALAEGSYNALNGKIPIKEFIPVEKA